MSIIIRPSFEVAKEGWIFTLFNGPTTPFLIQLRTFTDKCHHGKEENALFPALIVAGITKEGGPIGVMLHEHTVGREVIKEISIKTEQFKSGHSETLQLIANSLSSYINLLHSHIQKEENILFPMAERVSLLRSKMKSMNILKGLKKR